MNKSIFPLVKRFMIEIETFRYTILNASILELKKRLISSRFLA